MQAVTAAECAGCASTGAGTEDIEDAWRRVHAAACEAGEKHYVDPETGYRVFTEVGLRKRGKCCGCGCRHCPYHHENVPEEKRAQRIKNPAVLHGSIDSSKDADVLFWSGGKDSFLALREIHRSRQSETTQIVLLTTFEVNTRQVAHQEVGIEHVTKQAQALGFPLVGVPLHSGTSTPYLVHVKAGVALVASQSRSLRRLCFGDLHLEHIRQWREDNLRGVAAEHGADLHYPIWHIDYEVLLKDLQASRVPCRISAVTLEADAADGQAGKRVPAVGDLYSEELVEQLPEGVDRFGECGEFHTLAEAWLAVDTALPTTEAAS